MPFPITIEYQIPELFGGDRQSIVLNGGLTTFVGPNGSGKTQVMRHLKDKFTAQHTGDRKIRYLSGGRLAHLENYRSNYDGQRGQPRYENAEFGGKSCRENRHKAETAFGDFHTLSVRPDLQIKVAERLRCLFKRDIYLDWDAGSLKVTFSRIDANLSPYSSAREASGLLQLVVILAALYDDEVGALLLDEPELSLHPQLQAFLLREIQSAAGDPLGSQKKIVVLATHSTSFIDIRHPEDLARIVFFRDASTPPLQISSDAGELKNRKLGSLLTRLGQSHKDAFFSCRPLLVEGRSDEIICDTLSSCLNLYLGAVGTQIVPVDGKGSLPAVIKLMRMIGKSPVILADLDWLADGLDLVNSFSDDPEAKEAVQKKKGYASLSEFAREVYCHFCDVVDKHWNDIANDAIKYPCWTEHGTDDESIAQRRAAMAILLTSREEEIRSWPNAETWGEVYRRLMSLVDFLENVGCFILRRGTIEGYYQFADPNSSSKVSAAIQEADKLTDKDRAFVEQCYADIIRALRYASTSPKIDESSAISELLLSVIAPTLNRFDGETTDSELKGFAQQFLRDGASLFSLSNASATKDEPILRVELNSSVLDVQGFPVDFPKDCNVNREVKLKLGRKRDKEEE
jgi:ABC-type branched-subunit amino acid transport system ATPase component